MKALRIIIIILLILVAAFLIIAAFLPKRAYVEESMVMKASAKVIFQEVNNFENWKYWSPFEEGDTTMITTLEGSKSGVGAIMKWTGKDEGTQTIIESTPDEYIKTELDFMKGDLAYSEWKFAETDTGTHVTWTLEIEDLGYPVARYFGALMPGMMRPTYQKGLTNLKNICENLPLIEGLEFMTIEAQPTLIIKDSAMADMIGIKMAGMIGKLMGYITAKNIPMAGPPFSMYYSWEEDKPFVFDAGVPIQETVEGAGEIIASEIAAGEVVFAPYYGPYEGTGTVHEKIQQYLAAKGIDWVDYPWEVYMTDPQMEPDPSKWLTLVYYRIK